MKPIVLLGPVGAGKGAVAHKFVARIEGDTFWSFITGNARRPGRGISK